MDYFVGTRKDRDAVEGWLPLKNFEFTHVAPGLEVVGAQDPAYWDIGTH